MSSVLAGSNAAAAGITGGYGLYNQLSRYVKGDQSRVHFVSNNVTQVELDCTLSETHAYQTAMTQYPVEFGPSIAENMTQAPIELQLTAVVADNPVQSSDTLLNAGVGTGINFAERRFGALATLASTAGFTSVRAYTTFHQQKDGSPKLSRSAQIYNTLRRLAGYTQVQDGFTDEVPIAPAYFDVVTAKQGKQFCRFPNMVITSLQLQRDPTTGSRGLVFTINLTEVRFAYRDKTVLQTVQEDKSSVKKHGGEGAGEKKSQAEKFFDKNIAPVLDTIDNTLSPKEGT